MNKSSSVSSLALAKWALALFIIGILGAILIFVLNPYDDAKLAITLALMFFGFSEALALVFGIIGWRYWPGKFAVLATAGMWALMALFLWLGGR